VRSTSAIIVHLCNGRWARIDCQWDGYREYNGYMFFDHYTSQTAAEKLIALGNLLILGPEIGREHPSHSRRWDWCCACGRDLGDRNTEAKIGDNLSEIWPEEIGWTYVWDDGHWWVADPDKGTRGLVNLGDALMGGTTITTLSKLATRNPRDPPHCT
jgi:hypothetical protein